MASVLIGLVYVYLTPIIVFGASIEPQDEGLHIQQYADVWLSYEEVNAGYSFFLPPFHFVVVTTTRRFPLNLLISVVPSRLNGRKILQQIEDKLR